MRKKGNDIQPEKSALLKTITLLVLVFWILFLSAVFINVLEKKHIYPIVYGQTVCAAAKEYDVDTALIFSVIKTESGFNAHAVSDRGAIGLMQITPATGDYIAKKRGIFDYDLQNAATNIDFGCYYIRYLSDKFSGLTETMAAYNAGEGTVFKWLKNPDYSRDGVHLSSIPYNETDLYVKKIIKSLKRYRKLYGKLLDKF